MSSDRKYAAVWNLLKHPPYEVILEVHPSLVARVKKAVSKEKYGDFAFKLVYGHKDDDHYYLQYEYNISNMRLKIKLINRFGVSMLEEKTNVR